MNIIYHNKNQAVSDSISSLRLSIGENAVVSLDSSWCDTVRKAPFSRIYFIISGSGDISVNGKKAVLEPGKIYFIPMGSEYEYSCNDRLQKLYFHVNFIDMAGFDIFDGAKELMVVDCGMEYIEKMISLYCDSKYSSVIAITSAIYGIAEKAICECGIAGRSVARYSEHITAAMKFIKSNLSIQLSNKTVAEKLFVSESYLTKKFKAEVGITVGKYIDKLVFFEACRKLLNSRMSIRDISCSLGFCDQFYFSRRFSDTVGISPLRYRKVFINTVIKASDDDVSL